MKKLFLPFLICLPLFSFAQSANISATWANSIGGSLGNDVVYANAVDGSGNVYIAGSFEGTVNFSPNSTATNLTSAGGKDGFFAEYTSAGFLVWANRIGSTGDDVVYSIAADAAGNVFVGGSFNGTVDFDPSAALANLTSAGLADIFYAKYSTSGALTWVAKHGSTENDAAYSVKVDASGNVYIAGYFNGTVDFDPGATTVNKISLGSEDIFLMRVVGTGTLPILSWANTFGSTGSDVANNIELDASGVYVAGYYSGSIDLDPGAATQTAGNLGGQDAFFSKYTQSAGAFTLFGTVRSTGDDSATGIVANTTNFWVTGAFSSTATFYSSTTPITKTSNGGTDIFVARYDASTVALNWANTMGGSLNDGSNYLARDNNGWVYSTGYFQGSADFDPSASTFNLVANGDYDAFIAAYDPNSLLYWAKRAGGSGTSVSEGWAIATDASFNVYPAGSYEGTVAFGFSSSALNQTSLGGIDAFFGKYAQVAFATEPATSPTGLVFTNTAFSGYDYSFTAASGAPAGYLILRADGAAVTGVPVDGTVYTAGDVLGNATVRAFGSTLSYTASGLSASTTYHTAVFAYNGSGASINYRQVSPLIGNVTTLAAPPTITRFTPASGTAGTSVTITGTNFSTTIVNNIVYFGATKATVTAATATQLTVTVPAGATYQPISVNVSGLIASANQPFLITFPSATGITSSLFPTKVDIAQTAPGDVALGDLDGDGKTDLVLTNRTGNLISVYRNISTSGVITSASFSSNVDFATGITPESVTLADLDGDGKLDIATANQGGQSVSVFRNTSTSGAITNNSFALKVDFPIAKNAFFVTTGDIDGDGKLDLVVTNSTSSQIGFSILKNASTVGSIITSSFPSRVDFNVLPSISLVSCSASVADLDGDNKPEVIISNNSIATISVFKNVSAAGVISTSSFGGKVDFTTGNNPAGIAIGDLDGDGKPDLAVASTNSGAVSVFRNTGSVGVVDATLFALKVDLITVTSPFDVAINDMDGDGKVDLVASTAGFVSVFKNQSVSGAIATSSFATKVDFGTPGSTINLAVGDIDADGKPDLITANRDNSTFSIFRNATVTPIPTITGFTPSTGNVGATVTISGTNFSTTAGNNAVYFGGAKATITAATATQLTVTVPLGATHQPITVATSGLVAYSPKSFIVTFASSGTVDINSFIAKVDITGVAGPRSIVAGDLDNDSKQDLVTISQTNSKLSLFRNSATVGAFSSASFVAPLDITAGSNTVSGAIGDLDGDGKLDLTSVNLGASNVSVYRNATSSGNFTASSFNSKADFPTGANPEGMAIRDLDGDGKPEMIVAASSDNVVSIYENQATLGSLTTSSFASRVNFPVGTKPVFVAASDLDGDGKPDLVVVNNTSNTISILRNNFASIGIPSFQGKQDFTVGLTPWAAAVGDLDGDGLGDIVVANSVSNTISVFRNTSVSGAIALGTGTAVVISTPTTPRAVSIEDMDGDGKLDVVVANISGTVSIFKNIATSGSITSSSFSAVVNYPTGGGAYLNICDFDGDGKPDIAVANEGTISMLRNLNSPTPTITDFTPPSGLVGASVTIAGTNFSTIAAANTVKFNGTTAAITGTPTATALNVTVPTGATTGKITVQVGNQTATSITDFTVTTVTTPTISSFTPTSGSVGATVTITGTNFTGATSVFFGGIAATSFNVVSSTSITAVVGPGASGIVSVTTSGGTATLAGFTFVADVTAPTIVTTIPANNALLVPLNTNLIITFSEPVQKGTGSIVIKINGIASQTIPVTDAGVTISGSTVTINPLADFTFGQVNIEMAAGLFRDLSNNNFAGILNATTWSFTAATTSDLAPPTVTTLSPLDNATNVGVSSNLVITFNESVQPGTGNILIKEGGVTRQTIAVTDASVTIAGAVVTINPTDFNSLAAVNVEIAAGAFKDLANNNYAGILDATTWNFTAAATSDLTPPTVTTLSPLDNATNVAVSSDLIITFSESVQKGTGNILIKEGGVTRQTIAVTDASVTIAGAVVTINPTDFTSGAAVNVEIAAGVFRDLANNNYAGILDATTWNFTAAATSDLTPPSVTTLSPLDNATNIAVSSDLVITFSESVQKGTGNILIKEGGVTRQTIAVTDASVTIAGAVITINPTDFTSGAAVNVEIAAGVFRDLANNNYAGILDATTWNFTAATTSDVTPPTVTTFLPADNATNVAVSSDLTITFNENVQKGTGNILIKEGGVTRQTIAVTDASVTIVGAVVTINPTDFTSGAAVNVEIAAGAFRDLANNNYAGILDATTWNFTAPATSDLTAPTVTLFSPSDNATNVAVSSNLAITFSESVQKGTGNILIKEGGITRQTIAVTDASVTIVGAVVTINPTDFTSGAAVNVEIPVGAFKDLANNNYAGILDATTWNFTAAVTSDITPPALTSNATPASVTQNSAIAVSAVFTDAESAITAARIDYRSVTSGATAAFTRADMVLSAATYTFSIPGTVVTELGVEYRFIVTSAGGTFTSSLLNVGVVASATGLTATVNTSSASPISVGTAQSNYRLLAVPLALSGATVTSVFGQSFGAFDETKWRMFGLTPGTPPVFSALSPGSSISRGVGYWFLSSSAPAGGSINFGTANSGTITSANPFTLTLQPGWNLIGNPYTFKIAWTDIIAANPTQVSFLGPTNSIVVFRGGKSTTDILNVFEGGFVKSFSASPITITIPVTKNAAIQGRVAAPETVEMNSLSNSSWELMFDLKTGDQNYNLGGIGMRPTAKEGFDSFDDFNTPRFLDYLEVKMPKQFLGMTYTKDIVPTQENYEWSFSVESNISASQATIQWNNSNFGGEKELYLLDVAVHKIIDMNTVNSYSFDRSISKDFRVVFGSSAFAKEKLTPNGAILFEPYPNPFSEKVLIEYALPNEAANAEGEVSVFNALGEKVISTPTSSQSGNSQVIWDGSPHPAGIYFVRLSFGNQSISKKLIKK